jgi:hypothetical protein
VHYLPFLTIKDIAKATNKKGFWLDGQRRAVISHKLARNLYMVIQAASPAFYLKGD